MQNTQILTIQDFFHFDLFAGLMSAGIIQGIFLFVLLQSKPFRQPFNNLILAILVLSCTLILTEIFLGYSGLIVQALFLVDFSEPLVFLIGPLIYLLIRSMGGTWFRKKDWLHFLPFLLYFFYHVPFLMESDAVKYNSFLWAFHPEVPFSEADRKFPFDPIYLRRNLPYFIILHFGIYLLLAYLRVRNLKREELDNPYFFGWIRFFLVFFVITSLFYLVVKFSYENDLGDHFMAVFITAWLFFFSYKMLTDSGFFQPVVRLKYERSGLDDRNKQDILEKLEGLEQTEFYTAETLSLAKLAKQLGATPHHLSQVLNEALGKTYFEYIADLRIRKAREMLSDPATWHFKIEEIAERSGYLSKSAFTTAFKKMTGTTPGAFRKSAENKSSRL
ncbi:helix-turn-helix domain-containing protein [Sinomicrobium soli]|uniref:helix-turn-helix domain-containing protein n=1 Tax=Sinomicrobium sp. N-1-3-6 TaxID=2219864 RepID=UPI000DCE0998|nr:helix-turn-helix transcriptional regulator [Sinomicrobium sp. N-1-3-6]RAV30337.1 AraC family transcriptional regulator [Sinomicrobium sp. N-1-3-6]